MYERIYAMITMYSNGDLSSPYKCILRCRFEKCLKSFHCFISTACMFSNADAEYINQPHTLSC